MQKRRSQLANCVVDGRPWSHHEHVVAAEVVQHRSSRLPRCGDANKSFEGAAHCLRKICLISSNRDISRRQEIGISFTEEKRRSLSVVSNQEGCFGMCRRSSWSSLQYKWLYQHTLEDSSNTRDSTGIICCRLLTCAGTTYAIASMWIRRIEHDT
jgi:hypothetical protein